MRDYNALISSVNINYFSSFVQVTRTSLQHKEYQFLKIIKDKEPTLHLKEFCIVATFH